MEFHINISTTALALYAALLATVTAIVQIMNHLRDRSKVVLKVRPNMKAAGIGTKYDGMKLLIVTATNVGRRPITIPGFAAGLLYREGENETDWYLSDVRPSVPCEITEGKEVAAFVDQGKIDFTAISCWYAWDTSGRVYHLNVARWHERWVSRWRRKYAKRPDKKSR